MPRRDGPTIHQLIEAQEVALKALTLKGNLSDAIAFLVRDYERWQQQLAHDQKVAGCDVTPNKSMRTVDNAIQFLKDNPLWDRQVWHHLLHKDDSKLKKKTK